jgi:hypothetical protein
LTYVDPERLSSAGEMVGFGVGNAATRIRERLQEIVPSSSLLEIDDDQAFLATYAQQGEKFAAHAGRVLREEVDGDAWNIVQTAVQADQDQAAARRVFYDTAKALDGADAVVDPHRLQRIANEVRTAGSLDEIHGDFLEAYRREVGPSAVLDAFERGELTEAEAFHGRSESAQTSTDVALPQGKQTVAELSDEELHSLVDLGSERAPTRDLEGLDDSTLRRLMDGDQEQEDVSSLSTDELTRRMNGE